MGGPVQVNLHKLINKTQQRRYSVSARTSLSACRAVRQLTAVLSRRVQIETILQTQQNQPSLLSRLSQSNSNFAHSQIPAVGASQPKASAAAHQEASQHLKHKTSSLHLSGHRDSVSGHCPVCGVELPSDQLQEHVDQELSLLADTDNSNSTPDCSSDGSLKCPIVNAQANQPCSITRRPARARLQHPGSKHKVWSLYSASWFLQHKIFLDNHLESLCNFTQCCNLMRCNLPQPLHSFQYTCSWCTAACGCACSSCDM